MKLKLLIYFLLFFLQLVIPAQDQNQQASNDGAVYFFGPSVTETDSLTLDESEAVADFNYYTNLVVPYLRNYNIKTDYLTDHIIEVHYDSLKTFTVFRDSVDFGTILTDSKRKPKLLKYVLTDDELKEEIKKYFKLK